MSYRHLRDEHPQAHRVHSCDLCELPIDIGATHVRRTGIFEGRFDRMRMHIGCEMVTRTWTLHDWENQVSGEEFREEKARFFGEKP